MASVMFDKVIERVKAERVRQDAKWGEQNHDAPLWKLILDEELGETAKSYLEKDYINYVVELVQSVAVITAWAEAEYRRMTPEQIVQVEEAMKPKPKVPKFDASIKNIAATLLRQAESGEIPKDVVNKLLYGSFDKKENTDKGDSL